ncbi:MAG: BlaI/MecI/CopY family transcriptional regulator [Oscillospiraceae bacterium]|nr:BlaI/MecI/CopY family transcriptional regulator [Oscillospiraceae bacterium]
MKRLPDTELKVMKALWACGKDTPRAALEGRLISCGWAANTVNTYLARLVDKQYVSVRRVGKSNLYTPLVSQEDYLAFDSRQVLSQLYGSSPRAFVAALARSGLSQKDVQDLRTLLDELSRGGAND